MAVTIAYLQACSPAPDVNGWWNDETSRLEVGNNKQGTARGSLVLVLFPDGMYAVGVASHVLCMSFCDVQNNNT